MLPRSADPVGFVVNSEAVASSAYAVACMLPALFAAKVLVVSVGCNKLGHRVESPAAGSTWPILREEGSSQTRDA